MRRAFEYLLKLSPETGERWPDNLETEIPFGKPFPPDVLISFPSGIEAVVDGLFIPVLPVACRAQVKADASVYEVMAASILAKTARDRLMVHYGKMYPHYGYEKHKGYPTEEHRKLVLEYGPSPIQRMSFKCKQ